MIPLKVTTHFAVNNCNWPVETLNWNVGHSVAGFLLKTWLYYIPCEGSSELSIAKLNLSVQQWFIRVLNSMPWPNMGTTKPLWSVFPQIHRSGICWRKNAGLIWTVGSSKSTLNLYEWNPKVNLQWTANVSVLSLQLSQRLDTLGDQTNSPDLWLWFPKPAVKMQLLMWRKCLSDPSPGTNMNFFNYCSFLEINFSYLLLNSDRIKVSVLTCMSFAIGPLP